ncbi:MAG TPA: amino acid adenylation domain-containing protein, partial [Verrucomicrobiae bacterium]|nr:amino acid adenylation domain-containing protein [Verrucomicrobiae bacterium]
MSESNLEGIAIIGLTGRFPGAADVDGFWRNLVAGVESICAFSDEELAASGLDVAALRKTPGYVAARGILEKADWFDAAFFGMNPKEAEVTDPQQRLFLEASWEALENAGYAPSQFQGSIGVYAGMGNNTYYLNNLHSRPDLVQLVGWLTTMMANEKDFLATRVAYKLNLKGPAININTACSTSLVAVCQACQALMTYQCDIALAGGISVNFPQKRGYYYEEGGITSPDGHCRAFDAQAQGTVSSDGLGIVVLKRLSEALNDGDQIYAVIKGAALNNDGSGKVSFTSPSVDGQTEAIALAQAQSGFASETISYVETHGTGTPLGDPIEIEGLKQAFGLVAKKNFCAVGSVKSNIGHLDTAAGVAGLIKTALALKYKLLPASLHFTKPNPRIDFANSPFFVNTKLTPWPDGPTPRRAGVSSFGLGGTNAHVVLEEAPAPTPSSPGRDWQLLVFSARTPTALDSATANFVSHLKTNLELNLADAAYTLQVGRNAFNHRRAVVCRDAADAIKTLEASDPKRVFTQYHEVNTRPVVFMFPGQGAQYVDMGAELYRTEPVFAEEVDRCAKLLQPHLGLDLRRAIFPQQGQEKAAEELLIQTRITQPALFVIEYALARLWMSWGVKPGAMIGHSVGEYVAGCLAGVFSLETALELVAQRARLVQMQPGGAMLAVRLPEAEAQSLLQDGLSLAAVNSSNLCVISGPYENIERLERQLDERGIAGRRLQTSHAFHSAMMDPVIVPFTELLQKAGLNEPTIPYVSNVTAKWITAGDATNPKYWAGHVRQTVRFAEGVGELLKDPNVVLLEVGPGQTLSTLARQHPARRESQTIISSSAPTKDPQQETNAMLNALGKLWLTGVTVDWNGFHQHQKRRRVPLPTYPFERKRFWAEPAARSTQQHVTMPLEKSGSCVENTDADAADSPKSNQPTEIPAASRKEHILATLIKQLEELSGKSAADISLTASFLEMGFDSLFLAQASQAFFRTFGIKVTFRQLLEQLTTLNDLAEHFDKQLPPEEIPTDLHVSSATPVQGTQAKSAEPLILPLSEAQTEVWLATQWSEDASRAFNQVVSLRLHGPLQMEPLRESLNALVERHDALRTTFLSDGSGQRIAPGGKLELSAVDLSSQKENERENHLAEIVRTEDAKAFDLVNGPLARALLIKLAADEHVLLFASHHLVMDGWSISVVCRELGQFYSAFARGEKPSPQPAAQLRDYLQWQTAPENRAASAQAETCWLQQYANPPGPVELPGDRLRPAAPSFRAACESLKLKPALHQSLKEAAARQGVTLVTYLLASLNALLSRLSGQNDIALGVPAAGQLALGSDEGKLLMGHCVNLLPVRSRCESNASFADYLQSVKRLMLDAYEHQQFTYGNLVQKLKLPRDSSRVPLLTGTFNVMRVPTDIHLEGLQVEFSLAPKGFNLFDISVDVVDSETDLRLDCRFNSDLFDASTFQRWLNHWQTLLEATVNQPECSIGKLPLLDETERRKIIVEWNNTQAAVPPVQCLTQFFEAQVRENPDATALVFKEQRLTYRELNQRANRLAHHLQRHGVGCETLVGVCMERTPEMVIGLLAILKAGGAYVPLDPHYPAERLAFILEDTNAPVLLSQQSLAPTLPPHHTQIILLDTPIPENEDTNPLNTTQPDHLAYIIYTSGSTGRPKGVAIEHRNALSLIHWAREVFTKDELSGVLASTSICFDLSVFELFVTLSCGGKIVLAENALELPHLAAAQEVTLINTVPSAAAELARQDAIPSSVTTINLAGEPLKTALVQQLYQRPHIRKVYDLYGPSEDTTYSTWMLRRADGPETIGRPMTNKQVYLLDALLQPVPVGVTGELYIGGAGVARGYLHRPE